MPPGDEQCPLPGYQFLGSRWLRQVVQLYSLVMGPGCGRPGPVNELMVRGFERVPLLGAQVTRRQTASLHVYMNDHPVPCGPEPTQIGIPLTSYNP